MTPPLLWGRGERRGETARGNVFFLLLNFQILNERHRECRHFDRSETPRCLERCLLVVTFTPRASNTLPARIGQAFLGNTASGHRPTVQGGFLFIMTGNEHHSSWGLARPVLELASVLRRLHVCIASQCGTAEPGRRVNAAHNPGRPAKAPRPDIGNGLQGLWGSVSVPGRGPSRPSQPPAGEPAYVKFRCRGVQVRTQ